MTRDGLTLDNQTTGESINISSREAEQDYSVAEPGGTAEKVLERAGDIRERSKAKRAAKDGASTAAQATGPASRLQFTAEERADPALSKYIHKADKRADKLDAAKEALPKKRVVTKETVYDEALSLIHIFEELTHTLLREFVEKIVVHECSYDENKTRRQDIEIYYSFVGKVDLPE